LRYPAHGDDDSTHRSPVPTTPTSRSTECHRGGLLCSLVDIGTSALWQRPPHPSLRPRESLCPSPRSAIGGLNARVSFHGGGCRNDQFRAEPYVYGKPFFGARRPQAASERAENFLGRKRCVTSRFDYVSLQDGRGRLISQTDTLSINGFRPRTRLARLSLQVAAFVFIFRPATSAMSR
jgi:hypothetical protein